MEERDYSEDPQSTEPGPAPGESTHPSKGTPSLEQEGDPGQTEVPAPEDDVGVPPDEEMDREPGAA